MSDGLKAVARAARHCDEARAELATAVQTARREGVAWRQIAEILGVSRQAVTQRFGGAV